VITWALNMTRFYPSAVFESKLTSITAQVISYHLPLIKIWHFLVLLFRIMQVSSWLCRIGVNTYFFTNCVLVRNILPNSNRIQRIQSTHPIPCIFICNVVCLWDLDQSLLDSTSQVFNPGSIFASASCCYRVWSELLAVRSCRYCYGCISWNQ